jgi:hypothetical protein
MPTKLDKTLKREIIVNEKPYIVAISPEGMKITAKGKRNGQELTWAALVNGDTALAAALIASTESVTP